MDRKVFYQAWVCGVIGVCLFSFLISFGMRDQNALIEQHLRTTTEVQMRLCELLTKTENLYEDLNRIFGSLESQVGQINKRTEAMDSTLSLIPEVREDRQTKAINDYRKDLAEQDRAISRLIQELRKS